MLADTDINAAQVELPKKIYSKQKAFLFSGLIYYYLLFVSRAIEVLDQCA